MANLDKSGMVPERADDKPRPAQRLFLFGDARRSTRMGTDPAGSNDHLPWVGELRHLLASCLLDHRADLPRHDYRALAEACRRVWADER